MGTPRASAFVDQMRNEQKSERRGGKSASDCFSTRQTALDAAGSSRNSTGTTGNIIATPCASLAAAAVGSVGFCCGSAQDFIAAQHAMHWLFCDAVMLIAQTGPAACKGAPKSASTSAKARKARVSITDYSITRLPVDPAWLLFFARVGQLEKVVPQASLAERKARPSPRVRVS